MTRLSRHPESRAPRIDVYRLLGNDVTSSSSREREHSMWTVLHAFTRVGPSPVGRRIDDTLSSFPRPPPSTRVPAAISAHAALLAPARTSACRVALPRPVLRPPYLAVRLLIRALCWSRGWGTLRPLLLPSLSLHPTLSSDVVQQPCRRPWVTKQCHAPNYLPSLPARGIQFCGQTTQ